ncbi:hypothetical protein K458DRAFT_404481 [Lentithecium fluviatile CBS 122367]|uniref:Uncharacterized protein n=1 Tax=Lentithecium fluviatile CBS 122367 TaxID=1168545 RepID=A0A6G1J1W4_9PLEO|nr:hypothetical protein K458DRAFT_404481 [Lentithecium fluviatile CBS 122367]
MSSETFYMESFDPERGWGQYLHLAVLKAYDWHLPKEKQEAVMEKRDAVVQKLAKLLRSEVDRQHEEDTMGEPECEKGQDTQHTTSKSSEVGDKAVGYQPVRDNILKALAIAEEKKTAAQAAIVASRKAFHAAKLNIQPAHEE